MSRTDLNSSFIEKVWELVNLPQLDNLISWTQSGTSFVIKDPDQLARVALPRFFKHSNYSSFVRQLNMYGFHKNKSDLALNEFNHKSFQRDNKQLIVNIKRKALQSSDAPPPTRGALEMRKLRTSEVESKSDSKHEEAVNELTKQNQELRAALQAENMQKRNVMEKIRKFLTSLSAEMIKLELSYNDQENHRAQSQKLSMQTINNLLNHFSSNDYPFQYEVYEKYVNALLYLVPLKGRGPRQPVTIRNNVIIQNSQMESS